MSLRRQLVAASAAALSVLAVAPASAGPWALAPNESHVEISASTFSSGTAYDASGDRVVLPGAGLYERRAVDAAVDLGWQKKLWVSLAVPFASVTRTTNAPISEATATGLGDLAASLHWSLWSARSAGAVHVGWSGPSGYNRRFEPGLGDGLQAGRNSGLQSLHAGVECGVPMPSRGFLTVGGGYRSRFLALGARGKDASKRASERRWADLATADASLGFGLGGALQLAGLYHGELDVDHGDLYGETQAHLAGVRMGYRIDDRLEAFVGSWHSPTGTSVLHVDAYYAGVALRSTRLSRSQGLFGRAARP